jgi:alpha-mannosidase
VALTIEGRALQLAAPAGLRIADDYPHAFDAWEIDHYTAKTAVPAGDNLQLAPGTPSSRRGVLAATTAIGTASQATIRYSLDPGSRYLLVDIDIDWQEEHRLLRYHLPTAYGGRWATFGCPFGSIKRPQLPGMPADEAMWEVAGSRWAAVHDDTESGVAILTEAKYGFSCFDGDLGVSLLKAAKYPDPGADLGRHSIRFAIGEHRRASTATVASTACAAEALFTPVVVADSGSDRRAPFALADVGTLCPSWVLPSETGPGFVIRLHETAGSAGTAVLRLTQKANAVSLVDFREQALGTPEMVAGNEYAIGYAPYQVLSVLVRP